MEQSHPIASLLGCPEDVCRLILEHLSQADLRSICLVHRQLRTIAEPYLYSEITFDWKESQPHPITSLLRSILCRPQLAAYVRSVSLVGASFYQTWYKGKAPKIPVSESELEEPVAFVAKTRVPYRDTWLEELRNGTMEAFVAVLISQPLRLNRLFIGPDFFKESRIVGSVLRSALIETIDYGLRPDFGHLETVSLERYDDFYHRTNIRDPADVLPVFYLSSVKRISASIDNPVTFSWPAKHPPSCASLRSLKLTFIREPFLPQLLSVANQLESFEWEWYYSPHFVGDVHTPVIDLTQLNAALSYARNTLTELVVSAVSESDGVDFPPLRIQGSFEWISRFGKLRKFTVPLTVLMGFSADMTRRIDEFLPRSLEFLTITDDLCLQMDYTWEDHEIFSVLESWLEHFHTSTPRLRGIALPLTAVTDWEWNQTTKDDLRALGAKVGIEVEITKIE